VTDNARTVLVVDDDDGVRRLEADVLRSAGYRVEQAVGGAAAIEQLKRMPPDLVLLDLLMPEVDGWAVVRFIRTMPQPPRVLVVSGMREVVPPGDLAACVAGCVHKPFDIGGLLKSCAAVLAVPAVSSPATGNRRERRRTLVVATTLLSAEGTPLALGQLLEVSPTGFRLELALSLRPGDAVSVSFQIPGQDRPVRLTGRVRWRRESVMGAVAIDLSPEDAVLLQQLVEPADSAGASHGPEQGDAPPR
jgi:two-component system OmpR family response regulator